jgi:hypothetical protein
LTKAFLCLSKIITTITESSIIRFCWSLRRRDAPPPRPPQSSLHPLENVAGHERWYDIGRGGAKRAAPAEAPGVRFVSQDAKRKGTRNSGLESKLSKRNRLSPR